MRLGKPMEHLQAAMRAALSPGVPAEQITTIGRQLAYFGYLFHDTLVWVRVDRLGNIDTFTEARIGQRRQVLQPETQYCSSCEQARQPVLALRNTAQHHLWLAEGAYHSAFLTTLHINRFSPRLDDLRTKPSNCRVQPGLRRV